MRFLFTIAFVLSSAATAMAAGRVGFLTADGLCEVAPCAGWKSESFVFDAISAQLESPKRFDTIDALEDLEDVGTLVLPYLGRGQGKKFSAAVTERLHQFLASGGTLVAFGFTDPQWLIQVTRLRLEWLVPNDQARTLRTRMGAVEYPVFPAELSTGFAMGYRTFDPARVKVIFETTNDPGFSAGSSAPLLTARVQRGRFVHFGLAESRERLGSRAALLLPLLR